MAHYPAIAANQAFSARRLNRLRHCLDQGLGKEDRFTVVVTGSLGRHEANPGSDLDYFIIGAEADRNAAIAYNIPGLLESGRCRQPAADGPFEAFVSTEELIGRIGLDGDTNAITTRRLLFLLECEHLFNEALKRRLVSELIAHYVHDSVPTGALARFLINDVIRYYRTISVDFEVKIRSGRAWAPRRLKLIFSRKLLYFGGITAAAETAGLPVRQKRARLTALLQKPPLQRLHHVFKDQCTSAFSHYDAFLNAMGDPSFRSWLEQAGPEDRADPKLRGLLDLGKAFSEELIGLLHRRYPPDHPLHDALLM